MELPLAIRSLPSLWPRQRPTCWLPAIVLPASVLLISGGWAPWLLMWALAAAIYAGLKWLTWHAASPAISRRSTRRVLAYFLLWPGMDARAFLDPRRPGQLPRLGECVGAIVSLVLGAALFWGTARMATRMPLLAGWLGLFGLIFQLHFGIFRLASIFWRWRAIDATPLMRAPLAARSLAEFWGRRWNTAFHVLARDFVVAPLRPMIGASFAGLAAFVASGLVHELVISVPARGGFGLPTGYFVLQGLGLLAERTPVGRRLGLGRGLRGRFVTLAMAGLPAVALFHPPFVLNVVIPFMRSVGAL